MNKLKRIVIRLTVISFIMSMGYSNFLQVNANAKEEVSKNSYMFVVKDGVAYDEVLSGIKSKFQTLDVDNIKEINVFSISSDDEQLLNNAKQYIDDNYSDRIKEKGKPDKIKQDPINILTDGFKPVIKSVNRSIRNSAMLECEKVSTTESSAQYENWRWDIDKVTDNRESYDIEQGNHTVKVAVIDSGIDVNHPDLKNNIISNKSFVPGKDSLEDTIGHGTMVAGEIAANGNVKGVAPKVAIASYKVFDGDDCESSWVIKAIIQAANDNMDVINLSLGTYKSLLNKEDQATILAYERAILYAQLRNCVVVAASGNETKGLDVSNPRKLADELGLKNDLQISLPGGLPNVVTVSATNKEDKITDYSNYGRNVKIAAPGGDYGPDWATKRIPDLRYMALVTYPTNLPQSQLSSLMEFNKGYEFIEGGTSLAAPKVSAAAALIISKYKEKYGFKPSALKVEKLLYKGAIPGADGNNPLYYGNGILNARKSLELIKN
ncbi:S8 family serine peptidase [Clostridium beijerinckii]|uniref:S8 family serine peptidase n=1 Tax=Clostridium beijerinckii TaxID=1520 RepID=UPI001570A951|nr:S8 family serine peptidase [Clostridium beijerinckii]NRT74872.1 subtilisin family serine protease [Clostridium beijerinckii]